MSILFMTVLLFNLYGYQPLFNYLQQREDKVFSDKIYGDNHNEEFVSIKVATSLPPYVSDSREFEWANGEVLVEGTVYKYVKRRIFKDSIEYLCVAHQGRMQIENAREQFFKLASDLQSSSNEGNKSNSVAKPFSFESTQACFLQFMQKEFAAKNSFSIFNDKSQSLYKLLPQEQPPEAMVG